MYTILKNHFLFPYKRIATPNIKVEVLKFNRNELDSSVTGL
ncbi:hypothetical protein [Psychroflexus aestuariivivens]|nr:hypothetical protein [Psychroflexus aestuariivivens]